MPVTAVNSALLDAAFANYQTIFQQVLESNPVLYSKFASRIPSTTSEERYAWINDLADMREWESGERQIQDLEANIQALVNKEYERTFRIPRKAFEDDRYGVYATGVRQLAEAAAQLPDKACFDAMINGKTAPSSTLFDNKAFFATDHPVNTADAGKGTQSNLFTGTALTHANYAAKRASMMKLKAPSGRPLNIVPDLLIVPPGLEVTALQIAKGALIASTTGGNAATGGATNVLAGTCDVLVAPRLAADSDTTWYLACTKRVVKPIIWQERLAPEFQFLNRPTDPNVFLHKEFVFGAYARGAAGYGPYWLMARCEA